MAPCWFTFDPASLLVTSHYDHGEIPELPRDWLAHEYYQDDAHKMADVARSDRGVSTLHEATGGDPSRSPAWELYMRPHGVEQELLVALRTRGGDAWGLLGLYRETGEPLFDGAEVAFLSRSRAASGRGSPARTPRRRGGRARGARRPGLVVLRDDWKVESLTPGVERWLAELPDGDWEGHGRLPSAVLAVAGRALRTAEGSDLPGEVAVARVLTRREPGSCSTARRSSRTARDEWR